MRTLNDVEHRIEEVLVLEVLSRLADCFSSIGCVVNDHGLFDFVSVVHSIIGWLVGYLIMPTDESN